MSKTLRDPRWLIVGLIGAVTAAVLAIPTCSKLRERDRISQAIGEGRQIISALRLYASDHDGNYPPTLDTLLSLGAKENLIYTLGKNGIKQPRWVYQVGLTGNSDGSLPLIIEAAPSFSGKRIVGMKDTSVVVMPEEAYQAWKDGHGDQYGMRPTMTP